MTVKIRVQNFQSIEDSEIEVSGLTVITGTNNGGKSALHRAVFGAFTNARGSKFVRHGKDHCTVSITFGDGRSIVWQKGEKVNTYTVDGKVLNKVGSGAPPPEVQTLGILPVEASGREFWPQFAHQFTGQVFLLDQPGSVLAESIADVTRVGVLNEALRNTQSERRSLGAELKVRAADVARLEEQESTYAGLDKVEDFVREAEVMDHAVESLRDQLSEIIGFQKGIETLTDAVGDLIPVRWVEMPTSGRALLDELKSITEVHELSSKIAAAQATYAILEPISRIPFPDGESVVRAEKMSDALNILHNFRNQMGPLKDVVLRASEIRSALSIPVTGDEKARELMVEMGAIMQIRSDMNGRVQTIKGLREEISSLEGEFSLAVHDVQELLGGVGDCPICGRS